MMPSIALAWCAGPTVTTGFADSLVRLFRSEHASVVTDHLAYQSGPHLALARDEIVRWFLDLPSAPSHLLMVDSDISFTPAHFVALVGTAVELDLACLSGTYAGLVPEVGQPIIEAGRFARGAYAPLQPTDLSGVVEVDRVGAGFLLVRRSVFVALRRAHRSKRLPWFEEVVRFGEPVAEDWTFCDRVRRAGIPIYLDCDVVVSHIKAVPVGPRGPHR